MILVVLTLLILSCGRPKPVARVNISPKSIEMRYPHCAPVTFDWQPLEPLDRKKGRAIVFVHLLDGPHNLIRTFDHPLPEEWTPDKPLKYEIKLCQSALSTPLRASTYDLKIGLYDDEWGYRWPLETGGEETGRRGYRVAKVSVPRENPDVPRFTFMGNWLPIENVEGRQVLAHRWMTGSGAIALSGVDAPGLLHLDLHVPDPGGLRLRSDCTKTSERVFPRGDHAIDLALDSIRDDGRCRVELSSATDNPKARTRLNLASWIATSVLYQ